MFASPLIIVLNPIEGVPERSNGTGLGKIGVVIILKTPVSLVLTRVQIPTPSFIILKGVKMAGMKDLNELLKTMKPELLEEEFIFSTISKDICAGLPFKPLCFFQEIEGVTIICEKSQADDNNISYEAVWRMITLTVHSDLTAVGFLAAITNKLKEQGISLNVISAYYHDHLFVPIDLADKALNTLHELSNS